MTQPGAIIDRIKIFLFLDRHPHPDIAITNIERICFMMPILVLMHLVHVVIFLAALIDEGVDVWDITHQWRMGLIWTHGFMALAGVGGGLTALIIRKKNLENSLPGRVFVTATAFSYLLFGAVLCIIDQLVTGAISPYLVTSVAVALIIIMPPNISALLYLAVYLVFYFALPLTQMNSEILLSVRVNGISAAGIGLGVAVTIWRSKSVNLFQGMIIETHTREIVEKNRQLEYMAGTDMLTGLYNRMRFTEFMEREISRIRRTGGEACLIILDLDHFKTVNDKFGHPSGDMVLKLIAGAIIKQLRSTDILARFGGEEFAVLLPDTSIGGGLKAAEKIRHAIQRCSFPGLMENYHVTASCGLARLGNATSFDMVYQEADEALYRAKNSGRNRIEGPASVKSA
jgi:diguanylate cyclase